MTKLILVLGLAVAMTVGATSPCAAQDGKFLLNILEGAEWDSLVGDKPMLLSPTDSRSTTLQVFINPFTRRTVEPSSHPVPPPWSHPSSPRR